MRSDDDLTISRGKILIPEQSHNWVRELIFLFCRWMIGQEPKPWLKRKCITQLARQRQSKNLMSMEWVKLNNFTPGTLIQKCTLLLKWKSHFRVNCQIKTHLDNDEQLWRGDVAEFSTGHSISWNTEWQHEVVFNTLMLVKHFKSHVFCYCERWCTASHVCNSESRIKAFTTERHGSSIYLKTQKLNRSSSRVFALNHNPDTVFGLI